VSFRRFPLLLDLQRELVLVVGGGRVARRKIRRLLDTGAQVKVVSPRAEAEIHHWAEQGQLTLELRGARPEDLVGVRIAFLTSNAPEVNARLQEEAERLGVWVNRADQAGGGDFQVPGEANKGDLRVFLSTSGRSPALAKLLRHRVEEVLEEGWEGLLENFEEIRRELVQRGLEPEERRRFWDCFPDEAAWKALREGCRGDWRQGVERCLSSLLA
jgi:siroheme synthase-like protein